MAADKNVRMDGRTHRAFAQLSVKLDVPIKTLLSIAALGSIMREIENAAVKLGAKK